MECKDPVEDSMVHGMKAVSCTTSGLPIHPSIGPLKNLLKVPTFCWRMLMQKLCIIYLCAEEKIEVTILVADPVKDSQSLTPPHVSFAFSGLLLPSAASKVI
eukprot:1142069-Pelagomonas_calceolata.AAC.3